MGIQTRSGGAEVLGVDFPARIITVIAVPYHQVATVPYQGGVWNETVEPGAFRGVEASPEAVRVCREHNKADTVGKCIGFRDEARGLVAEIRIARTQRGDDTLALADEGMLSASVGFGIYRNGEALDHSTRTRRVKRAWLDHIGLVMTPAYDGARVLAVRHNTPDLDRDPLFVWAKMRRDPVFKWARARCWR
uniref:Caudovirus prohead protease n=2 Tax=Mycobacterium riyadhense TaxID=486698 RepID=A0A653F4P0_9MYCO|nr:Caudovirus prohead protease [Mycobacterium riyadhense]